MIDNAQPIQVKNQSSGTFEALLEAWREGKDVLWAELMAAWVKAPTAPCTPEVITKLIKRLDMK